MPTCLDAGVPQHVGIASALLDRTQLHFTSDVELTGPNLDDTFVAKQNGLLAMSWQHDRFLALAFGGFWEIEPGQQPSWIDTGRLMHGAITGDIDGDGDLDVLLGSTGMETTDAGLEFVTKVQVWERTPAGLVERPWSAPAGVLVGMPFAFMDIDDDQHLDIISYLDNELVGYFGDGAFNFTRKVLAQSDADLTPWGALLLQVEDRNADGLQDLLVVMGRGGPDVTFRNLVFLHDANGTFMHPAPPAAFESSPRPIAAGDVTGDGLADVIAQGFDTARPTLRLTASADWSAFAPTTSIEPASLGVKLGDVDADGTLDVLTGIEGASASERRLVAQLGRRGQFEERDLGLLVSTNLLDFVVRPSAGSRPASLAVLYSVTCDPSCDEGCLDRCFQAGCVVCSSDAECPSGFCQGGSCASRPPRML